MSLLPSTKSASAVAFVMPSSAPATFAKPSAPARATSEETWRNIARKLSQPFRRHNGLRFESDAYSVRCRWRRDGARDALESRRRAPSFARAQGQDRRVGAGLPVLEATLR